MTLTEYARAESRSIWTILKSPQAQFAAWSFAGGFAAASLWTWIL